MSSESKRIKELEDELNRLYTDLPYVMGWNDGFNHALTATLDLKFPKMLRKMWSGSEVQKWIDERKAEARQALRPPTHTGETDERDA